MEFAFCIAAAKTANAAEPCDPNSDSRNPGVAKDIATAQKIVNQSEQAPAVTSGNSKLPLVNGQYKLTEGHCQVKKPIDTPFQTCMGYDKEMTKSRWRMPTQMARTFYFNNKSFRKSLCTYTPKN
jgi:hypothetical protein